MMDNRQPAALLAALRRGTAGSALILTGEGDLLSAARSAAAAMECEDREHAPCGHCGPCRKVRDGIHPDVTVVEDPQHKMIAVDVLRSVRSDAYILPNEGRRKVYIFPDCALLDQSAQNVLLKVIEEGPDHAAFLFCAQSAGVLLPTIRSRCAQWRIDGAEERREMDPRAAELCRLLGARDRLGLASFFTGLETARCSREEMQTVLEQVWMAAAEALLIASGCQDGEISAGAQAMARGLSRPQLSALADLLREQARQLRFNLNVGHAAGALSVSLRELLR